MNCTQNDTFHICQRDCKPIQIALREAINHVEDNVATDLKTCLGTEIAGGHGAEAGSS